MSNPEQVKIVKQGREAIAEWRARNPHERLDLREARLTGLSLSGADLSGADFWLAELVSAHLATADLSGASLVLANLSGASLVDARLVTTDLGATILARTDLSGADLTSAKLDETVFGATDLSGTHGLDRVEHQGPVVIDERTLRKSWPLPEVFLRGCGLSDQYIEYLPSLMNQAIEFYSCFISYSSKDDEFARRVHADLQDNGVRCWFAPEDLKIGDRTRLRIDESIRLHDKLLLILSEGSVESDWVEAEVEAALEKERNAKERSEERTVLFPIRLDGAVMESDGGWAALVRNTRHIGDFTRWKEHDAYRQSFERLLRDLKSGTRTPDGDS